MSNRMLSGIAVLLLGSALPLHAQGVLVFPRAQAVSTIQGQQDDTQKDNFIRSLDSNAKIDGTNRNRLFDEAKWVAFWGQDQFTVLQAAQLSVGGAGGSLYNEVASTLSGAWRFSAGTTVATAEDETDEAGSTLQQEEEDENPGAGFHRFVAGGGNLSIQGTRPLWYMPGSYSNHYLFVIPRGWVDVPGVGNATDVESFGGDLALEYDYHRLASDGRAPVVLLQLRGGLAAGTDEFYDAIGYEPADPFWYVIPTVAFVIQDKVKIAVTGFLGPNSFEQQDRVQVSFAIVRKPGEN